MRNPEILIYEVKDLDVARALLRRKKVSFHFILDPPTVAFKSYYGNALDVVRSLAIDRTVSPLDPYLAPWHVKLLNKAKKLPESCN